MERVDVFCFSCPGDNYQWNLRGAIKTGENSVSRCLVAAKVHQTEKWNDTTGRGKKTNKVASCGYGLFTLIQIKLTSVELYSYSSQLLSGGLASLQPLSVTITK
jgi:hypothetical protein